MVGAAKALRQAPVPTPAAGANAVNTEHRKGGTLGTTGTDTIIGCRARQRSPRGPASGVSKPVN